MNDFRIVHARCLLQVYSISPIRGFNPPSIVVIGDKLNTTSEILYNGILATEFVISSSSRLIVRIPASQVGKDITDFQVFSSKPQLNQDASLIFEVSKPVQKVSGIDRLVQSWMILFMTTPGSDVFVPSSGGGAKAIIGSRTDKKHKSAAADLAVSIDRTARELTKLQSRAKNLPPQEKLLSSSLESVSTDESTGTLSARVRLKNMVNQSANVSLS